MGGLYQRGILGVLVIALSVVTLLGLLQDTNGIVVDWWIGLLRRLLGWGSYVAVLAAFVVGALLAVRKMPDPKSGRWHVVIGLEIVYLALLGLVHLVFANKSPWEAARAGLGGGYTGAVLSAFLNEFLGPVPTALVLGIVLGWGLITISGRSFVEWVDRTEEGLYRARVWLGRTLTGLASRRVFGGDSQAGEDSGEGDGGPVVVWGGAADRAAGSGEPVVDLRSLQAARLEPFGDPLLVEKAQERKRRSRRQAKIVLPSIDLLQEPDEAAFDQADLRAKAMMIEETFTAAAGGSVSFVLNYSKGKLEKV